MKKSHWMFHQRLLRQGQHHDRAAFGAQGMFTNDGHREATTTTRNGHELAATDFIGDRLAPHGRPSLEFPQQLTSRVIKREGIAHLIASEHQAPSGGQRAADQWILVNVAPFDRAARRINRRKVAIRRLIVPFGFARATAPERNPLDEGRGGFFHLPAAFDHRHIH